MSLKCSIGKVRHSVIFKMIPAVEPRDDTQQTRNDTCHEFRILKTTNNISAFDFVFPFEVPGKGKILQMLSVLSFLKTKHILPNCFVGILDENHLLFWEAKVFDIEFVMRGYLSGSLYRLYEEQGPAGVFKSYGVKLEEGLQKNQKLSLPLLTPTTKSATGHDVPLTLSEMEHKLGNERFLEITKKCKELFKFGTEDAKKHNLILVDTKYELGQINNELVLVDEVHTPDSSRFWIKSEFEKGNFVHLSKEFLREKILAIYGSPDAITKHPAHHPYFQNKDNLHNLAFEIARNYQNLYSYFCDDTLYAETMKNHKVAWPISQNECESFLQKNLLPKNILVIGDGGRDYTIATCFANFPEVQTVYCACGDRLWENAKFKIIPNTSVEELALFAAQNNIGLVISGPEAPIAQGIARECEKFNVPVLAPSLECACLETSKILCKKIIESAGVLTPKSHLVSFEELKEAVQKNTLELPCVIKYDSLAQGKGVFVVKTKQSCLEALQSIEEQLPAWNNLAEKIHTNTYSKQMNVPHFLIEEFIEGEEISAIALCNDTNFKLLPIARDYKRRNDNQTGPNTGGMGAVCPISLSHDISTQIKHVFSEVLNTLHANKTPYYGFLFAGFIIKNNKIYLLEFNCRLGDPETQVVLPGLSREFFVEIMQTSQKQPFLYEGDSFEHDGQKRIFVVGASPEYPYTGAPKRTLNYTPNPNVHFVPSSIQTNYISNGGRMFGLLSTDANMKNAREKVYSSLAKTFLEENSGIKIKPHYRTDIGQEL